MAVEKFPVEAGHIMLFARAVGDPNPIYADEGYAAASPVGHAIAPPTFVQASAQYDPDYPLRPKIGEAWFGSGREASGRVPTGRSGGGSGGTGLHAEQHYEYIRHPKPGDILSATHIPGKTWEREGGRGGHLSFTENITEYRDQNGDLVVIARGVGVRTSKPVEKS